MPSQIHRVRGVSMSKTRIRHFNDVSRNYGALLFSACGRSFYDDDTEAFNNDWVTCGNCRRIIDARMKQKDKKSREALDYLVNRDEILTELLRTLESVQFLDRGRCINCKQTQAHFANCYIGSAIRRGRRTQ